MGEAREQVGDGVRRQHVRHRARFHRLARHAEDDRRGLVLRDRQRAGLLQPLELVDAIAAGFNATQKEYKVVATFKGSYPESMTAAIAAFRAGNAPHLLQVFEVGTATMMSSRVAMAANDFTTAASQLRKIVNAVPDDVPARFLLAAGLFWAIVN